MEQWLAARQDHFELFHDLERFGEVHGERLGPLDLGTTNIDHLVLTGDTWLIIDAKGCGTGTLGLDPSGRGVLRKPDGAEIRQVWLDDRHIYSRAGIIYRLTDGMQSAAAWIVPGGTLLHPSVREAACTEKGGIVLPKRALTEGYFNQHFTPSQSVADPAHIKRLSAYLSIRKCQG